MRNKHLLTALAVCGAFGASFVVARNIHAQAQVAPPEGGTNIQGPAQINHGPGTQVINPPTCPPCHTLENGRCVAPTPCGQPCAQRRPDASCACVVPTCPACQALDEASCGCRNPPPKRERP